MKYHKKKWIHDRLYEVYVYLGRNGIIIALVIADVQISLDATIHNFRNPPSIFLDNP